MNANPLTRLNDRIDGLDVAAQRTVIDHMLGAASVEIAPKEWDDMLDRALRFVGVTA